MPDNGLGALIKKHARLHGVDARLVWAVIRHESGFNPQAVSPKGAMGLMQLIPGTAALMGVSDPFDVEQNISGGVRFLKLCLPKFNNNVVLALAAYNAGPENVTKYQGCPPFAETRNYVLKVMRDYTGKDIALPLPVLAAAKGRQDEEKPGRPNPPKLPKPSGIRPGLEGSRRQIQSCRPQLEVASAPHHYRRQNPRGNPAASGSDPPAGQTKRPQTAALSRMVGFGSLISVPSAAIKLVD